MNLSTYKVTFQPIQRKKNQDIQFFFNSLTSQFFNTNQYSK